MSKLANIIRQYAASVTGQLGVGYLDLVTGESHYTNKNHLFPTASVFKVPVLIALFDQVEQGNLSLTDPIALCPDDLAPGSGVLSLLTPGLSMSVLDYAVLMMVLSDNTATDMIYRLVGRDAVRAVIDRLELHDTRSDLGCKALLYGMYNLSPDMPLEQAKELFKREGTDRELPVDEAYYTDMGPGKNYSSPADMIRIFSLLDSGKVVSPEACEKMLGIMSACQTNARIPFLLPDRGPCKPIRVAHKTGTVRYVANDCGIVETAKKRYALALFYNGIHASEEEKTAVHHHDTLLARLSKDIFDAAHAE